MNLIKILDSMKIKDLDERLEDKDFKNKVDNMKFLPLYGIWNSTSSNNTKEDTGRYPA